MQIAVINESKTISNHDCDLMCKAIQIQLDSHFCPAWDLKSVLIAFFPDPKSVPEKDWIINILDTPTQAGALGYHSENNDKIDAFIFSQPVLSNGGVSVYDPRNPQNTTVASVLSHEVLEMVGDPFVNCWADGPQVKAAADNQVYSEYAWEMCDPVEEDSYEVDVGTDKVSVSNFILPSWFNAQATLQTDGPFDYLKKLNAPFTMTHGGYLVVRQSGNVQQIFAHAMPQWKQDMKKGEWYRR